MEDIILEKVQKSNNYQSQSNKSSDSDEEQFN
jgi:hypothetical protein